MFRILAVLLAFYIAGCLVAGSVYGRRGAWGRRWRREEDPFGYWSAVGAYVVLAIAMFFLF